MADNKTPAERAASEGTNRLTDSNRLVTGDPGAERPKNTARTSSDLRPSRNAANEADLVIDAGQVYREKNGNPPLEVIPFFVDVATARVHFAPVGTSHEDILRMPEFVQRFEKVDRSRLAEATPDESQRTAEKQQKEARANEERLTKMREERDALRPS
jgi:hypothetical protein